MRRRPRASPALDEFQLLPSEEVDLQRVEARPGNLLVPVRKPHVLTHLSAALHSARDRDIVVMTVRLVGLDVPDDPAFNPRATDDEKLLLSAVVALAERHGRAIRLLIAPGVDVSETVAETALRLQIGGDSRRRIGDAARTGTVAAARQGVGARVGSRSRSAFGSSSTIRAAPPPPTSSARTPRRWTPAISI